MMWPGLGNKSVVRTTTLDETTATKITAQRCVRENDAKIGAAVVTGVLSHVSIKHLL